LTTLLLKDEPLGPEIIKNHDSPSYTKTISLDYESYFVNMDETHCPVKSCKMLAKDCKAPYTSLAL